MKHIGRARPLILWILGIAFSGGGIAASCKAADRIVLRNLQILTNRTVTAFDADGVRLDDGSSLGWNEIETARIDAGKQEAFDQLLERLGPPLSRIAQRLRVGDFRDLLAHAEKLEATYLPSSSETAYTVMQALMWGRLSQGRYEEALVPYLRCLAILQANPNFADNLPGDRRLQFDAQTGLCSELPPICFQPQAAADELPDVLDIVLKWPRPRPAGIYLYFASLATTAGQPDQAVRGLRPLSAADGQVGELRTILEAQIEGARGISGLAMKQLETEWSEFSRGSQPLALYWLGTNELASDDPATRQQGLLHLLRIPAAYGSETPILSAAALDAAMRELSEMGDALGGVALRNELLTHYAQTWHAQRAVTEASKEN